MCFIGFSLIGKYCLSIFFLPFPTLVMILCRWDFLEASTCKQWMYMRLCGLDGQAFYMLFHVCQWGECPDERTVEARSQDWKSSSTALHIPLRDCAIFVTLVSQRAFGSCLSWTQHWHYKSILPYQFLCGFQGSKLRFSCLCNKHFCPLSHFLRSQWLLLYNLYNYYYL